MFVHSYMRSQLGVIHHRRSFLEIFDEMIDSVNWAYCFVCTCKLGFVVAVSAYGIKLVLDFAAGK